MTLKFGQVIESGSEYEKNVRSLPDRPKHLNPPQPQFMASPQIPQSQPPPQTSTTELKAVPRQPITIENLRVWWQTANHLGKPEPYKERIAEIASQFKATGQLSPQAMEAMQKDTVNRIAQIAHKIVSTLGQQQPDGSTRVQGKIYDITFNAHQKDWAIAHKNGDVILDVKSQQVQINKVTPKILQDFESVNNKLDEVLAKDRMQGIQR
ncbi:hypothetical protein [Aulosira sp. FACHB-615]|uniref:hypothetical protein n=1 Tax=Aulosira sp. FACHB-615 TaxID=2692777 RepID=UPI001682F72B|nr:hypothetical protein [Aulosira sp. FACHB-615]